MKPVLGIVGGIGSGKSAVAAELVQRGGRLINADAIGHDALRDPETRAQVVARFGSGIVNAHGDIERRKLGAIVFADMAELHALEAIVFPFIKRQILAEIQQAQDDPAAKFVILDAAVMLEAGWNDPCDKLIFVDAPRPVRLDRVARQRGWTDAQLIAREKSQMTAEEKKRHADAVLDNGGTLDAMRSQLDELLRRWKI